MPRTRTAALAALCVVLAGCAGLGAPDAPTPASTTTQFSDTPTTTTALATESDPTFQLRVKNDLGREVTYCLVLRDASNDTVFHNRAHAVGANENAILDYEALGDRSQFGFTVRLNENTSVSKSVFAGQGYQVTIRGEHNVTVRELAGSS